MARHGTALERVVCGGGAHHDPLGYDRAVATPRDESSLLTDRRRPPDVDRAG
jgi:hypothetical protein